MIKEKSKNRLALLENKRPTHTEGTGIVITQEAQDMMQPWEKALERLEGQTLYYEDPPPPPGCVYANRDPHRSIVISKDVWFKALGDAIVDIGTEDFYKIPESKRPPDMRGIPKSIIDARVAQKAIISLKEYGVLI